MIDPIRAETQSMKMGLVSPYHGESNAENVGVGKAGEGRDPGKKS